MVRGLSLLFIGALQKQPSFGLISPSRHYIPHQIRPLPSCDRTAANKNHLSRNAIISQMSVDSSLTLFDTASSLLLTFLKKSDPEAARGQFFFALGAGSGAGGIGARAIPTILKELDYIRSLQDVGPTQGGESLSVPSPFATLFYPTDLSKADVEKVISSVPKSDVIVAEGDSEAYFVTMGYVDRKDFAKAASTRGCNPLAAYAAFDALSNGRGSFVSPVVFDEKLDQWRNEGGLETFASDLQTANLTKVLSYAGLAFLLLIALDIIVENGINGFLV